MGGIGLGLSDIGGLLISEQQIVHHPSINR
jgi:hypothetical protein